MVTEVIIIILYAICAVMFAALACMAWRQHDIFYWTRSQKVAFVLDIICAILWALNALLHIIALLA